MDGSESDASRTTDDYGYLRVERRSYLLAQTRRADQGDPELQPTRPKTAMRPDLVFPLLRSDLSWLWVSHGEVVVQE